MQRNKQYANGHDEQVNYITRLANNSILAIWIAGIFCMLVMITYLIVLPQKNQGDSNLQDMHPKTTESLLADKTVMLNIGLRVQAITYTATEKPSGHIVTRRLMQEKRVVLPKKAVNRDFSIKAVPK